MNNLVDTVGHILGILGILVCLVTAVVRISGAYIIFSHEPMTWFVGGIALMVMGCLAELHALGVRLVDANGAR